MEIRKSSNMVLSNVAVKVYEIVGFIPAIHTGVYCIVVIPIRKGLEIDRVIAGQAMEAIHGSESGYRAFVEACQLSSEIPLMGSVVTGTGGARIEDVIKQGFSLR